MLVISVSSLKGGVGKTSVTLGLASAAFARGIPTLVVDMDPQADASTGLDVPVTTDVDIADVLAAPKNRFLERALVPSGWTDGSRGVLDVIPGSPRSAEFDRPSLSERYLRRLDTALTKFAGDYRLVLIDCPPSLNGLTRAAWTASQRVAIVTEPGLFSVAAADRALRAADELRRRTAPKLQPLGLVVNRMRQNSREHDFRVHELREMFGPLVLNPPVVERTVLQQAQGSARPIHRWPGDAAAELASSFDALLDRALRSESIRGRSGARRGRRAAEAAPAAAETHTAEGAETSPADGRTAGAASGAAATGAAAAGVAGAGAAGLAAARSDEQPAEQAHGAQSTQPVSAEPSDSAVQPPETSPESAEDATALRDESNHAVDEEHSTETGAAAEHADDDTRSPEDSAESTDLTEHAASGEAPSAHALDGSDYATQRSDDDADASSTDAVDGDHPSADAADPDSPLQSGEHVDADASAAEADSAAAADGPVAPSAAPWTSPATDDDAEQPVDDRVSDTGINGDEDAPAEAVTPGSSEEAADAAGAVDSDSPDAVGAAAAEAQDEPAADAGAENETASAEDERSRSLWGGDARPGQPAAPSSSPFPWASAPPQPSTPPRTPQSGDDAAPASDIFAAAEKRAEAERDVSDDHLRL